MNQDTIIKNNQQTQLTPKELFLKFRNVSIFSNNWKQNNEEELIFIKHNSLSELFNSKTTSKLLFPLYINRTLLLGLYNQDNDEGGYDAADYYFDIRFKEYSETINLEEYKEIYQLFRTLYLSHSIFTYEDLRKHIINIYESKTIETNFNILLEQTYQKLKRQQEKKATLLIEKKELNIILENINFKQNKLIHTTRLTPLAEKIEEEYQETLIYIERFTNEIEKIKKDTEKTLNELKEHYKIAISFN
jgi:hypothetical protein